MKHLHKLLQLSTYYYICVSILLYTCPRASSTWSRMKRSCGSYADVCWRMLAYADVCWRMLTYADVCWRMLTYADVCWRMLTYATWSRMKRSSGSSTLSAMPDSTPRSPNTSMCPHTTIYVSAYYSMCPHLAIYLSSYYMCPHTTTYASSCYYMCPHTYL